MEDSDFLLQEIVFWLSLGLIQVPIGADAQKELVEPPFALLHRVDQVLAGLGQADQPDKVDVEVDQVADAQHAHEKLEELQCAGLALLYK